MYPSYLGLVREFYTNLKSLGDYLKPSVKEVSITITPTPSGEKLGVPIEGLILRKQVDVKQEEIGYKE